MVSEHDRGTIRRLAEDVAAIAAMPIHREIAREWRRLNGLRKGRPLVWINEIPWHEMNFNDELTLVCADPLCRQVEWTLRTTIYQWKHMRADMVVEPVFYSRLAISDSGYGIHPEEELIPQSEAGGICAHRYRPQIHDENDIKRIKDPVVTHDEEASERTYETLVDLLGDILEVKKLGIVHYWFAPWDLLVQWWGVERAMIDIVLRPELVHMAMERLVGAHLARLRQWEELNLLSLPEGNYRVGSGGLGYSDEIPAPGFDPARVRTVDQWGCATAQIFSSVSPEMHEEFALRYERRWMERFGLNYYGCCDPLHDKLDLLASVPNLRKVSMSCWVDVDKSVPKMAGKYVFSYKPSPAVFAVDTYDPELARRNLLEVLEKTEGCVVEVIMKDISTVRSEPQRLWNWAEMAMDVVQRFA